MIARHVRADDREGRPQQGADESHETRTRTRSRRRARGVPEGVNSLAGRYQLTWGMTYRYKTYHDKT